MRASLIRRQIQNGLGAAFLLFAAVFAVAGLAGPAEAAVVSRIDVQGNQRVDAETVRAYVLVQPGQSFSALDVDQSLKALFETGLFADVDIQQSGGALVVTVVENPIIDEVAFEGNKRHKDDMLAGVVQSKPRGVFTQAKVQADVQTILELYRRSGRFQGSVTPKTIELPNNRVNLVFEISEGPKTGVSRVNFIGNQAYGDARLRSVVDTRQTGILSFIRRGDIYDPARLSSDEEKLTRYYRDRGYADFQVVSSVADLDRERNKFFVTFTVDEGPRYRFGEIFVDSTIPGLDTEALRRAAETDAGEVFSGTALERSQEALTLRLAGSGHPFAQVRTRLDRNPETLTVGVTYIIDEGARVYVERIDVRGNNRTRGYVIRREFDLAEGDAYNRVLIQRAERRLRNLGYFSDVRIFTEPGSSDDRVVVVVAVTEEPTGELSFGAGYSTSDGIIGDVSLSERNFLGRGYHVRAGIGGGQNARSYEFSFTDPYFLGRRISAGFNVYRREYDETSFREYDFDTIGGGLTFGFPITDNFTVQLGYQIEQQEIDVDGFPPCPAGISLAVCQAQGETITSSVLYSLIYDSLDDRRDPRDGIFAKFTQEFAGVGGDVSFLRTTASASYYRELMASYDMVGLLRVQGGHIVGLGEDVRLAHAFFKGGETIRGFESAGFGPRDRATGDALGSNVYLAATAEVQFPMPMLPPDLGFKAALFADAGTAFETDADDIPGVTVDDDASIRSSVGGSILWASPLGPLRADFAYVLTSENYDEEQFFRVGGGTRF